VCVAAEPGCGSIPVWEFLMPADGRSLAVVFGNEALGIEERTLAICDGRIELPMMGSKASINVGNACAAILFELASRDKREEFYRKKFSTNNED
jgi:tRNA G18 (ribose-2'-O)-methylase SpoU